MSVTRGTFLKSLGKSLPGMVLGSGVAVSAQKLLAKMVAASGNSEVAAGQSALAKPVKAKPVPDEFIYNGPATGNRIALTFDDGPMPGTTDRILDELKQRGLHATFFMIGQRAVAAPDLARRVLAEGHEVANHTFTHARLRELPDAKAADEIQKAQDTIAGIVGHRPAWFRPPFGALRQNQTHLLQSRSMRVVLWSVDPRDWAEPGEEQIRDAVFRDTKAGAIIVCHDNHGQTANAVGQMLDGLLERGFSPVTMSTLMES